MNSRTGNARAFSVLRVPSPSVMVFHLILCFALVAATLNGAQAKVVYVNKNAPGPTYDGTSWANAFLTIQAGITAAVSGDEVWVAKSAPAAEAYIENVTMKENVALYGGFAGIETDGSQRNWTANVTVISSPSTYDDVVQSSGQGAILDGFSIRNGRAGVYVVSGTATVTNCTISGNTYHGVDVDYDGMATVMNCSVTENEIHGVNVHGTATVTDCTISGNEENGVLVSDDSTATISDCFINNNRYCGIWTWFGKVSVTNCVVSQNGSGVESELSLANLRNCTLSGNRYVGIGVYTGTAPFTVTDCTISANGDYGVLVDGTATLTNCTISRNEGYGVHLESTGPQLANCIVAFNGTGVFRHNGVSAALSHNDVFGNTTDYSNITDPTGTNGNISADPLFVDRDGNDYRLQSGSPCIDTGDDSVVTAGQSDLDGNPRIQGAHVDMGAYEFTAGTPPYALSEAVGALKVGAGLLTVPAMDRARMDIDTDGGITILDAARIARKVAGLEANP